MLLPFGASSSGVYVAIRLSTPPAVLAYTLAVPLLSTYTPKYQVERALSDAPVSGGFRFRLSDRAWAEAVGLVGQPTHPLDDARRIEDPASRANMLGAISIALLKSGSVSEAISVADEALESTNSIDGLFDRYSAQLRLAEYMASRDELVGRSVSAIQSARRSAEMLEVGQQFRAFALANVASRMSHVRELAADAESVLDLATTAASLVYEPSERWQAATSVARIRSDNGWDPAQVLSIALETVDQLRDPAERDTALRSVTWLWAESGNTTQARASADRIKDPGVRAGALSSIVAAVAKLGQADEALVLLGKLDDERAKVAALNDLVQIYEDSGQFTLRESALQRLLAVDNSSIRAEGLLEAAKIVLGGNDRERAKELLEEALHDATQMPLYLSRASFHLRISHELIATGALDRGMAALELGIQEGDRTTEYNRYQWVGEMVLVADRLFEMGYRSHGISLVRRIHKEALELQTRRESALSSVAETLAYAGFPRAARSVCEPCDAQGKIEVFTAILRASEGYGAAKTIQ